MKRCPTCNRTYTDPNLSFCVDDGTPLTEVADDESTIIPQYRPPGAYVAPPERKRRRVWPWLLGVVAAFVLGVAGLMIAAAIFVPRMMRERQVQPPVTSNANTDNTEQADTSENVDTPPPTDEEQVLAQLRDLENEWTAANLNADKEKLGQILADDYVDQSGEGGALQGKTEYINTIRRNTDVEKWEFDDLEVRLAGTRATLTGKIKYVLPDREEEFEFIDKFVWRNGRWQATGSEVKRRE
ncbi:MAG TPA: DUF4440 domain-containing protein [Pyrinomonadaceae bacterium]|nr:DUF4440 domain-containing protein [Pyrinomonadaceae bacterium]